MPRKKSGNNTKSVSDMVSDITSSDILPIATSSPADKSDVSVSTSNLNIKDFEDYLEATRKKLAEPVEKLFHERKSEIKSSFQELSSNDFNYPATINDLKASQKLFNEKKRILAEDLKVEDSENNGKRNNRTKVDRKAKEDKENDDSLDKKKLQFAEECNDDDSTFKKPLGRTRRTTRNPSFKTNSYQTPKTNGRRHYNVAMVTPGPNSQKPISILRRPNPGEMAISMTGSPLLIAHNNVPVHVPQISIPLSDGRVVTVLANEDLDPDMSICSEIDSETQERLVVLQQLLKKKTRKIK